MTPLLATLVLAAPFVGPKGANLATLPGWTSASGSLVLDGAGGVSTGSTTPYRYSLGTPLPALPCRLSLTVAGDSDTAGLAVSGGATYVVARRYLGRLEIDEADAYRIRQSVVCPALWSSARSDALSMTVGADGTVTAAVGDGTLVAATLKAQGSGFVSAMLFGDRIDPSATPTRLSGFEMDRLVPAASGWLVRTEVRQVVAHGATDSDRCAVAAASGKARLWRVVWSSTAVLPDGSLPVALSDLQSGLQASPALSVLDTMGPESQVGYLREVGPDDPTPDVGDPSLPGALVYVSSGVAYPCPDLVTAQGYVQAVYSAGGPVTFGAGYAMAPMPWAWLGTVGKPVPTVASSAIPTLLEPYDRARPLPAASSGPYSPAGGASTHP